MPGEQKSSQPAFTVKDFTLFYNTRIHKSSFKKIVQEFINYNKEDPHYSDFLHAFLHNLFTQLGDDLGDKETFQGILTMFLDTGYFPICKVWQTEPCKTETPLSWVASYGDPQILKMLIDNGKIYNFGEDYDEYIQKVFTEFTIALKKVESLVLENTEANKTKRDNYLEIRRLIAIKRKEFSDILIRRQEETEEEKVNFMSLLNEPSKIRLSEKNLFTYPEQATQTTAPVIKKETEINFSDKRSAP